MRTSGRFGEFGGCYVPQVLLPALEQLEAAFLDAQQDDDFKAQLNALLRHYAGRPTPLYRCRKLGRAQGIALYLKREDLLHGGAHKTNQVLGQGLLAKRMGKRRLIAETGAGQHGVATALAGALFGLETRVYMGKKDMARQQPNVFRMRLMGAEVVPVENGSQTLKDAINEAMRDWTASYEHTHYMLGTAAGPHPYPTMVRDFQRVIGDEARAQILEQTGRLPDAVIACVGGGSNAIGMFHPFVKDEVPLIGVEPAGRGMHTEHHGATLQRGRRGILHGADTYILQTEHGQIEESYSISAGLDYPGVGPEHVQLMTSGRARYVGVTDQQAVDAFQQLCQKEGILPALESSHALAYALAWRPGQDGVEPPKDAEPIIVVNLSGRGDKDVAQVSQWLAEHTSDIEQAGANQTQEVTS